jgi:hypothetical protein
MTATAADDTPRLYKAALDGQKTGTTFALNEGAGDEQ